MEQLRFLTLVEGILEADSGSINTQDSLDSLGWDSLAHLSLIAELDRFGDLTVDVSLLSQAKTVADLFLTISAQ